MHPIELHWDTVDEPSEALRTATGDGLDRYNDAHSSLVDVRHFGCSVRDGERILGGALARIWGANCELQLLWVDDNARGQGLGKQLVERVEAHAAAQGCTLVYLSTFSFQAPGLYLKLGYETALSIDGFPGGVSKFMMRKQLGG